MSPDRIALLTFAGDTRLVPEFDVIKALVLRQREKYCKRHGYQFLGSFGVTDQLPTYYAVRRLQYVLKLFHEQVIDAVWVLNLAAVITNLTIPIPVKDGLCIVADPNGLNAGSMILHRSSIMCEWLSSVIVKALDTTHPWHEQHIIQQLQHDPIYRDIYNVLPSPSINQYLMKLYGWSESDPQNWKHGDYVVHFPGLPLKRRVKLVRWALTQVVT